MPLWPIWQAFQQSKIPGHQDAPGCSARVLGGIQLNWSWVNCNKILRFAAASAILSISNHFQEYFHHLRIEVFSRLFLDEFVSLLFTPCRTIGAIAGDCIPNIHDCKEARYLWNLLTLQTARIAAAIPFFVMSVRNIQGRSQIVNTR